MDKISFERNKSGFQRRRTENINGYEYKVYGASNVEVIARMRNEYLAT